MKTQIRNSGFRARVVMGLLPLLFGCAMNMDHGDMDPPSSVPIPAINYDAVFVVSGGGNSIVVINAATNAVADTILLRNAAFPHHLYMSPDRMKMALAVPGMDLSAGHGGGMMGMMGAVLLMDATTGATLAGRKLDGMNHNAVFSPDGMEIWTSRMAVPGQALVLDAVTLATRQTLNVGGMPAEITFSRNGRYAFVANGMSNSVTVLDANAKVFVKTIAVDSNPVGAWPGTDGRMYVDNEDGKTLSVIDTASLDVVLTYDLGFTPGIVVIAPNGELWVTDSDSGQVAFYRADADSLLGRLNTGVGAHAVAFSGDGNTAYVSNQTAGTVSVIDIASRSVTWTIPVGPKPNGLLFRTVP